MWVLFRWRNNGILAFLKTRNTVFANMTYLHSLNRFVVLCSYKALMDLRERRVGFYWAYKQRSFITIFRCKNWKYITEGKKSSFCSELNMCWKTFKIIKCWNYCDTRYWSVKRRRTNTKMSFTLLIGSWMSTGADGFWWSNLRIRCAQSKQVDPLFQD